MPGGRGFGDSFFPLTFFLKVFTCYLTFNHNISLLMLFCLPVALFSMPMAMLLKLNCLNFRSRWI